MKGPVCFFKCQQGLFLDGFWHLKKLTLSFSALMFPFCTSTVSFAKFIMTSLGFIMTFIHLTLLFRRISSGRACLFFQVPSGIVLRTLLALKKTISCPFLYQHCDVREVYYDISRHYYDLFPLNLALSPSYFDRSLPSLHQQTQPPKKETPHKEGFRFHISLFILTFLQHLKHFIQRQLLLTQQHHCVVQHICYFPFQLFSITVFRSNDDL